MSDNKGAFRPIVGCGLVKLNRYLADEKAWFLQVKEDL